MWNESDVIANELYTLEASDSDETVSTESKLVMVRSSTSDFKRDGFTFTWRIENFSSFGKRTGEYIESPTFLIEKLDSTEWYLRLYPRGDVDPNYIACYLYRKKEDCGPSKIVIGYKISFITNDGTPNLSGHVEKLTFAKNKGFGNSKFKKRDELLKKKKSYLPRDTLTVWCHMWKCFFEKSVAKECFATTKLGVEKCYLSWSIKNFSACETEVKQDVPFKPASVKIPSIDIKWYLSGKDELLCIDFTFCGTKIQSSTFINCSISLLDSEHKSQLLIEKEHFFEPAKDEQVWRLPPLIEKRKILSHQDLYLPDDTLSLTCELSISLESEISSIDESTFMPLTNTGANQNITSSNTLKKELLSLYRDNKFCDVTIQSTNKTFQAHKSILSARSTVLSAVLQDNKFEENGNVIKVLDVDEYTLEDMLIYIYSETIDNLNLESAIKLYCAADKYQVWSLKSLCSMYLKSILTTANVCLVLALADEHKDNDMKKFVQEFICNNASEIFNSKQWKDFMVKKAALSGETMHKALKKY